SACSECPPKGVQVPPAPWTTPTYHACTPMFAAGAPFAPDQEYGLTVIRLEPIVSRPPKELPPQRPITAPLVRPRRIEVPEPVPDVPPVVPTNPPTMPKVELRGRLHLLLLVDSDAKDA